MPPDVRVHVRLGSIRLAFEGDRSFYEKHVETLVDAASRRGIVDGHPAPAPTPPVTAVPAAGPATATTAAARDGHAAPAATPPKPQGFVPQSGEFGRYVRRLGPEAAEPDRQVVALAFYLWNYEKRATFGRAEIEGCFQVLRIPLPAGLDALFQDLTDRKRFLEVAGEGSWRLSRKGENYVKTRLLAT